jgi:hypothetical protein
VLAARTRQVIAVCAALYAAPALGLTFARMWEHVGNVERGTFTIFLLIPVALLARPASRARTVLLGSFTLLMGAYVLAGSIDAEFIRYALGLSR